MRKWLIDNIKNFDVVHLHDFRSYQNSVVYKYTKKYGIPYVLQAHGSTPRMIEKKRLKWLFDVAFGYKILKDADGVIAVSKEEAEYDKQMGVNDGKVSVIYNGMDIESFKTLPIYGKFKKKYDINGKMILYLGRINKSKGIDFVIKAFSKLVGEVNNIILVIAGSDDGYKPELEKLIEKLDLNDKIKFTGFVDEKDKIAAYVDADVFVHTVRYMGGVGLTPLEAILSGTPVIVTDECGEVIKEANAGYLVKYGDINALKEKMKSVIENPGEGKEMVERGEGYIRENFMWDEVVRKVEEIYVSCAAGWL
ncbi:MAG: D-inositol-3-phosphate glycosyltransferase [Candidatus Argoarchaeum ethanivorans]|uniref:D-inositol-3-phosphate glycosyltransferase n=1 Tax=Candidatus Argoarchaeum ethanivorans TaxID=2608793 RepID=A0A811T905_9EURY|nr:MAG: D-inositol-3-phosphate glycosyltransferase [Candidatus Argoarchaeum ethanivorans]